MRLCIHCGGQSGEDVAVCSACGSPLADAALPNCGARNGERRQLTILFCDLVGSTSLSERLDPEDLLEIIGTYQRVCAAIAERYGGAVTRLMGDGILAYFGYPRARENDAESALRAGLAMVNAVSRLKAANGSTLQARVGVASGVVVVGDERAFLEGGIVGEIPNLAARLQALAEPGSVVVSAVTRRLLRGQFAFEDLGLRALKGFRSPVQVWRAKPLDRRKGRFEAAHGPVLDAIVGREAELDRLETCWERAKAGTGQMVLLSAEAGVGKSRLVHALLDRLQREPHARRLYHCSPFHTNSALHPLLEQLQRVAGLTAADPPAERLAKFTHFAQRTGLTGEPASLLAYLLSLPGSKSHPRQGARAHGQMEATLAALADLVADIAATETLLMVVEDLHWGDPTSLALIDLLADRICTLPMLMVLTFRPGFVPRWAREHVSTIALSHLGQPETRRLLQNLTGHKPLPAEVQDHIVAQTDGVPLFVEELTRAILELPVVRDAGDHYELNAPVRTTLVPATLRNSLMARLDRLGPAREVAQIGAAIGRSFPRDLLAAVVRLPERALSDAMQQLTQSGLVLERSPLPHAEYTFKHALVHDTAYDSLLRARRRTLHDEIARTLLDRFPNTASEQPELIARHFTAAERADLAVQYWLKAAQRSAERASPLEATFHYRSALANLHQTAASPARQQQELAILIALMTLTMSLTGYGSRETEAAIADARQLAEALGETSQFFAIMYGEWVATLARGDIDISLGLARRFMHLAERGAESTPLIVAHRMLGASLVNLGELAAGREQLERCVALYVPTVHSAAAFVYGQDSRVSAMSFLSWALLLQGDADAALLTAQGAVENAEQTGHAHTQAVALCLAGLFTRVLMNDEKGVQAHIERTLTLSERHGLEMWRLAATIASGWLKLQQGSAEAAIREIGQGIDGLATMKVGILRPFFLGLLAEARGAAGQLDQGLAAIAEALLLVARGGERIWLADLLRIKGSLLAQTGAYAEAEAVLQDAVATGHIAGAQYWELRAATALARLWLQTGRVAAAIELLTPFRATAGLQLRDHRTADALFVQLVDAETRRHPARI